MKNIQIQFDDLSFTTNQTVAPLCKQRGRERSNVRKLECVWGVGYFSECH